MCVEMSVSLLLALLIKGQRSLNPSQVESKGLTVQALESLFGEQIHISGTQRARRA